MNSNDPAEYEGATLQTHDLLFPAAMLFFLVYVLALSAVGLAAISTLA